MSGRHSRFVVAVLVMALLAGCVDESGVAPGLDDLPLARAQAQGGGGKPDPKEPAIHAWHVMADFRDFGGDGILSDGRGPYTSNNRERAIAYDYELGSVKEDRIVLINRGIGSDPRFVRLAIPGGVEMDCGYSSYLVSSPDLFDQPPGTVVTDGHLKVECAEDDSHAPRYVVEFAACVTIANPVGSTFVVSTEEGCPARLAFDGTTVGFFAVTHGLHAEVEM